MILKRVVSNIATVSNCNKRVLTTQMAHSKGFSGVTGQNTKRVLPIKPFKEQKYDYFLVLDFEATCESDLQIEPQEIIEFPVLKVSGKTFEIESKFHKYVEPEVHPQLTTFCTELTGIIQDMVDGKPDISETLQAFNMWMEKESLLKPDIKSIFVTCGDWDLRKMLPKQCSHFNIEYPSYLNKWINIKKPYSAVTGTYPKGMMPMLDGLNLQHVGRHHSGIDDCTNIAAILKALAQQGFVFKETGHL